jgi:predicted unusual protein kinase regulating ubiquinone biosynthesis (AarF/ABC1/UbiB family)
MSDDPSIPSGRLKRLTRLAGMATHVGASLASDRLKRLLGKESDGHEEVARRVLETLGTLKGAALKAGQALTLFSSQLPPEARAIVGRLFSQAPRLPYAEIVTVLETELGAPPPVLFAEFSEEPFAAASLGQVHAARLKSGEEVAVKVQYPGVGEALEDDLRNLESLLKAVGVGGMLMNTREYAEEIRRELSGELDYQRELAQLEHYRGLLSRWPDLVVPRPFPELCARRVLTLERLEGPTLNEFAQQVGSSSEEERFRRGEQLVRAVCGPWILHRTIHADTHPGNYLALPDGRLGVLDFGSVKTCSERFWRCSIESSYAIIEGQELDWADLHRRAGFSISLPEEKARRLIGAIIDIATGPLRAPYDHSTDTMVERLTELKLRYPLDILRIHPPAESLLVGRALAGLLQNLRALQVKGDLRPFLRETLREAVKG